MAQTHGAKMLSDLPWTAASVAERVGVSSMAVSYWRRGSKAPGPKIRVVLEQLFKIPVLAWDVETSAPLPAPGEPARPAAAPAPRLVVVPDVVDPSTAEAAVAALGRQPTIAQVDGLLGRIRQAAQAQGLPAQVVARFYAVEATALAKRLEAEERDELRENRIAREHPAMKRALVVIRKFLDRHPEDGRELAAELDAALEGP